MNARNLTAAMNRPARSNSIKVRLTIRARIACLAVLVSSGLTVSAAELRLGQAVAAPGSTVSVPVTFAGTTGAVAAQFDVRFDPSRASLTAVSAGGTLAGHVVDQEQIEPGHWRALVYSTTNGPISEGVMVRLGFTVPTNSPDAVVPLVMSDAVLAMVAGQPVQPLAQADGMLTIASVERLVFTSVGADGSVRATITGVPGRELTLQGSPDLFHWADLSRLTNQTGLLIITNSPPAGRSAYFYRTAFRPATNPPVLPRPVLSSPLVMADGRARFQLDAAPGSAWRIEGSPDLFHWGNYGIVTNPSGTLAITNTPFSKPPVYFHRAAQP